MHTHTQTNRFNKDMRYVSYGIYRIKPPLIKPSKLTAREKGGVGKELSDGWALNFAIGCTHACRFCYVDSIHKRFTMYRLPEKADIITRSWGMYLLIPTPESMEEAIRQTEWHKWEGKEVMLSSTHDPYLPELARYARRILEHSLPYGIHYLIQTRSVLVRNDLPLLEQYREQVRLQVSIMPNESIARQLEARVPSRRARLNLLKSAKKRGLTTGAIIAPILPLKGWLDDLEHIMSELADIGVDMVYGELLHVRGSNLNYIEEAGVEVKGKGIRRRKGKELQLDTYVGKCFNALLRKYGLNGQYWYE